MHGRSVTFRLASSQSDNQGDSQSVSAAAWQESYLSWRPSGGYSQRCYVQLWNARLSSECIIQMIRSGQNTKWKQKCRIFMDSGQCLVSLTERPGLVRPDFRSIPLSGLGEFHHFGCFCCTKTVAPICWLAAGCQSGMHWLSVSVGETLVACLSYSNQ